MGEPRPAAAAFALSLAFEGPHQIAAAFANLSPGGLLALDRLWVRDMDPVAAPASRVAVAAGAAGRIAAAWIALGESPSAGEPAGAAIILAGLALATSAVRVLTSLVCHPPRILGPGVVRSADGD